MAGCYLRLREMLDQMTSGERRIAQKFIDFPTQMLGMPIGELAALCQTSKSTVVRLCKTLGYRGYKDFNIALSSDLALNAQENMNYEDIHVSDSVESIARSIARNNSLAIENTLQVLSMEELDRAIKAIHQTKRVDFFGVGSSGLIATDAQTKFLRINKRSMASTDPHIQTLYASNLMPGDVAVFISYSGETVDTLDTMDVAKARGATIVAITKYNRSPLSEQADICLFTSSQEATIRSGATGSRIAQLTIIDILFTAVASLEYNDVKEYLDITRLASLRKRARRLYRPNAAE